MKKVKIGSIHKQYAEKNVFQMYPMPGMRKAGRGSASHPLWVIGVDEVGRGSLAGPVTVAAVAAPFIRHEAWSMNHGRLATIKDSKKLSALQRKVWDKKIRQSFFCTASSVNSHFIDTYGISMAVRSAVAHCLKKLLSKCSMRHASCYVFLDGGLYAPPAYKNQKTIIKGDELHPLIAAASIVAKVHRDRYMVRLAEKYPRYGFEKHKGYGTAMHKTALAENGLSLAHRLSFCRFYKTVANQSLSKNPAQNI